ncbi:maleylpyruvate isomerase family mycothiol-dependent enzyme [Actinomadura sp. WMMB 499]|uniref:maleylpyruvate isomerase family mycothiol-dependent enzyme n=1 Tax=Actinomadura sp. WMMB 499 TaxID=1219491 RepID=UPI001246BDAA|nr:maleylpyruvate isomerase family mycothiol-dependent enzyme [Actinomadura sp. WMMB 499]QFG24451.1 maleylpyruvate isomerase family mycothiol-dependent enzyme [Actinomadura sp. WMMB 499]
MDDVMRANIDAWEQTLRSSLALAATLDAADWDRPTECPGWTVKDQFSHLVGVERGLLGDPEPEVEVPAFDHVRSDFGAYLEAAVHVRRDVPGPEVAAELADVLERRLVQLEGIDPDGPLLLPNGKEGVYRRMMVFRAMDCWTHEQDVRRAVGRPGNLDAPAAHCLWSILGSGLPMVVARRAKAGPGESVLFTIAGPPSFRSAITVGADGRAVPADPEPAEFTTELAMDLETYVRLAAGRCTPNAVTVETRGDRDLAGRILATMPLTT